MEPIEFKGGSIGGDGTFVVAEAGSNHNGDFEIATELIDVAADAGADAVKFQTFRAENVYVEDSGKAEYLDDDRSLYEIIEDMEMPYEWIPKLEDYAAERDILFMSTPSDPRAADELEPYVPLYKIESFHLSNHPYLRYLAKKNLPLILSTGAHPMSEVREAVGVLREAGLEDFVLLQCVSAYPTPLDHINVRVLETLREEFDVHSGLSDHTLDPTTAPVVAVALGASVIEKHFTLDKTMEGPDHEFALEPDELASMVDAVRKAERVLGSGEKRITDSERELYEKARRFIHATKPIKAGERVTESNVDLLSPGEKNPGLKPKHYEDVIGQRATRDIDKGEGISWDYLE